MHQFVRDLLTEWRRLNLPFSRETIVVAVSGGADSVSLLLAVNELQKARKLDLRIVAAHFNHHLRGAESDSDERMVKKLCTSLRIELSVGHGELQNEGNLEQNARHARYAFLTKTAETVEAHAILTGHTVNDQAETFLMNLVRGSGPDGLGGMKAVRPLDVRRGEEEEGKKGEEEMDETSPLLPLSLSPLLLVRPMLTWAKRKATEGFCRDMGVEPCYDTMNEDTAFKRVRIRKILLPLLEDMNPNIIETLANTASLMQGLSENSHTPVEEVPSELDLKVLRPLSQSALYAYLRVWLDGHRGTKRQLSLTHIKAIERLIHSEKSGRVAELPGGMRVIRSRGKLSVERSQA
ncbi:MAG: tRNA lysidine(34) synthetase TilS [Acidobacteria bacterium]|nr:tRNA lysidine(34) synthetase TilS [Acidobacteriota bacterium]